jgi:hypothetical protein
MTQAPHRTIGETYLLNGITGITDEKSHSKYVACETIVAPGRSELVLKLAQVPCSALDGLGMENPGVLRIWTRTKEFQILGPTLFVPTEQRKQLVFHIHLVNLFDTRITINIRIGIQNYRIIWNMIQCMPQEIRIGETVSNNPLIHLFTESHRTPFILEVSLVQQYDLVYKRTQQIVF